MSIVVTAETRHAVWRQHHADLKEQPFYTVREKENAPFEPLRKHHQRDIGLYMSRCRPSQKPDHAFVDHAIACRTMLK